MSLNIQTRLGEGFELLSIKMRRFMNYQKTTEFNFNTPYVVITGPTGAGKTTILDALTFALFRYNSRTDIGVKIEDMCKRGGRVQCIFKTGSNVIRVERGREKTGKSFVQLWINQQRIPGKIPEIDAKIRSILGMNYKAFINSTIIRQEEMKSLGSKRPSERMKTLQNLFRLDIFEKARNTAQEKLNELKIKGSNIEGKLYEKEQQIKEISTKQKELESLLPGLRKLQENLQNTLKELESLEKEEKEMRLEKEKFQTLVEKRKTTQEEITKLSVKLERSNKDLISYQNLKKRNSELEEKVKELHDITTELESLKSLEKQHKLITDYYNKKEQDFARREKELGRDLQRKLKQITEEKKRTQIFGDTVDQEEAFKILNQEGRLLERIQRISIERTWDLAKKILDELQQEQLKAREDLEVILQRKEKISKDSFVISEIKKRINELESEKNEIKEKVTELQNQKEKELDETKKELTKLDFNEDKKDKLRQLEKKKLEHMKIQKEYENVSTLFKKAVDPSSEIKLLKEDLERKKDQLKSLEKKLENYEEFKEKYFDLTKKIEKITQEKDRMTEKQAMMREKIRNLEEEIKKLKKIEPEIDKLRKELKEIADLQDVYKKLKDEIFHTKGAPFYAINKILPRLGRTASFILSELTDNRLSIIELRRKEGKNMGFEILVDTPEGYRDVATFSGGEKTQINAALRLAISEELTAISGSTGESKDSKKTLFIDEGDLGSLDTIQAQQAFVKKLFQLQQSFKIILITHLTDVANEFPYTINITRDTNGKSIVSAPLET